MSQGKPKQKGVEAIFTPPRKPARGRMMVGAVGILAGIALWAVVIPASGAAPFLSSTLGSLGILFATCGAGICIASMRRHDETAAQTPLNIRLSLVVFLQSVLIVILYASLTQEYRSNLTMRQWVKSVFMFGDYLFNGWVVGLGSFILAALVVVALTRQEI